MSLLRPIHRLSSCLNKLSINRTNYLRLSVSQFHQTSIVYESNLAKLRKKTGYAFQLCRKALEQNDQDLVKAEKWLKAEAAKQGWEKAERVKSRTTGQGLIGIYTNDTNTQASMVEIKCETDFVARNENFIRLVSELARKMIENQQMIENHHKQQLSTTNGVEKFYITDQELLSKISNQSIVEMIQKLGENIRFVRACLMQITDNNSKQIKLLPYAHAVAGKIESNDKSILLGKYGTIVAVTQSKPPNESNLTNENDEELDQTQISKSIDELGSRLGQHIIGLSPKTIDKPADNSEQNLEELTGDEESDALLKQKFIFNEDITVEQYLKNSNANIVDFIRIECGEEH